MFTPHQYVAADPAVGERLSVTVSASWPTDPFAMYLSSAGTPSTGDRRCAHCSGRSWRWRRSPPWSASCRRSGWLTGSGRGTSSRSDAGLGRPGCRHLQPARGQRGWSWRSASRSRWAVGRPARRTRLAATHRAGDRYRLREPASETHTRAAWLGALAGPASSGRCWPRDTAPGSSWPCSPVITTVAANWSTFTSADRKGRRVAQRGRFPAQRHPDRVPAFERKPPLEWLGVSATPVRQHLPPSAVERRHRVRSLGYGGPHQNELAIPA